MTSGTSTRAIAGGRGSRSAIVYSVRVSARAFGSLTLCSLATRAHLKLAKVDRVELHDDVPADPDGTGGSKRADFHSFRRLFCTSLAVAGVNIQTAMELAGHRRAETALRYVKLAGR